MKNARRDEEKSEEIEITPEMIEAGARVLIGFETETCSERYWAQEVYLAMREIELARARS